MGGLAYYISPPRDFSDFLRDPIHGMFYTTFVMVSCAVLGRLWLEVSGMSSKDVVKNLVAQDMYVDGYRDGPMKDYFERYIPTAAALGGCCVGILTVTADMMGAIGSGTGILLAVTIIYGFYEQYDQNQ